MDFGLTDSFQEAQSSEYGAGEVEKVTQSSNQEKSLWPEPQLPGQRLRLDPPLPHVLNTWVD